VGRLADVGGSDVNESPLITFGDGMTFERRCEKCNRFVKPFKRVKVDGQGQPKGNNATCRKCGRTRMLFIGYY
jgi:uncharacterized protein with PIN domain